jgi:hypothetical protein
LQQDSHELAAKREERERERKVCRLVVVEGGLGLRRVGDGYVKKNEQVN